MFDACRQHRHLKGSTGLEEAEEAEEAEEEEDAQAGLLMNDKTNKNLQRGEGLLRVAYMSLDSFIGGTRYQKVQIPNFIHFTFCAIFDFEGPRSRCLPKILTFLLLVGDISRPRTRIMLILNLF